MSRLVDLIYKKRNGETLEDNEICYFVNALVSKEIDQCQLGAMLMAIFLKGMTTIEIEALTHAIIASGSTFTWPAHWSDIVVDKHSTGGVGDKISLILTPALVACGLKVPMITGRGLGFTGGTLDKMESIPGFRVSCNMDMITRCMESAGCCIVEQTMEIVPADGIMYSCRGVTSTVDSIPLICSSIMAKKAAEGLSALVFDIKVGSASFMQNEEQGTQLAENLVMLARHLGIKSVAVLTQMNWPIGHYIGNALEVAEAIYGLNGQMQNDVKELVLTLGGHLLVMTGKAKSLEEGSQLLWSHIADGSALIHFKELLICQGVEQKTAEQLTEKGADVWATLPKAQYTTNLTYECQSGYVQNINAKTLAEVCLQLGTGRLKKSDAISYSAGLELKVCIGQSISKGSEWIIVHHDKPIEQTILEKTSSALTVGQHQVCESATKRLIKVLYSGSPSLTPNLQNEFSY